MDEALAHLAAFIVVKYLFLCRVAHPIDLQCQIFAVFMNGGKKYQKTRSVYGEINKLDAIVSMLANSSTSYFQARASSFRDNTAGKGFVNLCIARSEMHF